MSAPLSEKKGALIRGRRSLNISCQKGGNNSREAFFRVNTVLKQSWKLQICFKFVWLFNGLQTQKKLSQIWQKYYENAWTQSAFTYSKLTIEKLEQGVKYVQSYHLDLVFLLLILNM